MQLMLESFMTARQLIAHGVMINQRVVARATPVIVELVGFRYHCVDREGRTLYSRYVIRDTSRSDLVIYLTFVRV